MPPAPAVVALIDDDAVDPGLDAAATFEAADGAIDLQEDVLRDVLGFLRVAQEPGGQIEDHPVTIRMVFGGGGLEVGEFQLHKFTR